MYYRVPLQAKEYGKYYKNLFVRINKQQGKQPYR